MQHSILFVDKVFLKPLVTGAALRGVELFNLNLLRDLARLNLTLTVVAERSWQQRLEEFFVGGLPEVCWVPHTVSPTVNALKAAIRLSPRRYDHLILGNVGNGLIPAIEWMSRVRAFDALICIAHRRPSKQFARRLAKRPSTILAVNEVIAQDFRDQGCLSVVVDYGVVEADRFTPRVEPKHGGVVDFCVVGSLESAWKGADTAMAAYQHLPEEIRSQCRLHLAGYKSPPPSPAAGIRVYPWKPASEMPVFLQSMDVMIVPSRDEGVMRETFSQATVQGMLSGLPVLHSTLPILREKFDAGGGIAFSSIEELSRSMATLVQQPDQRKRMGQEARDTALKRYVWDSVRFAKRYLNYNNDYPVLPDADAAAYADFRTGSYEGLVSADWIDTPAFSDWVETVSCSVAPSGIVLSEGRHRVVRVPAPQGKDEWAVKQFGRQPFWKDVYDKSRGSKARRSFLNAFHMKQHGVGTPEPIACLERWEGSRLVESFYISRFEPDMSTFKDELITIYRNEPESTKLMALLQTVADGVAALHRSGLCHGDMGNQNIFLRRRGDARWGDVMFIDLNRARMGTAGSWAHRAFDLSRLCLSSEFLRILKAMYGYPLPTPKPLDRWESFYRKRFALHTWSRSFRHPIRTLRNRHKKMDTDSTYPPLKDLWIWDECSGQAISTILRPERVKYRSKSDSWYIATTVARALPNVKREYDLFRARAFTAPVLMKDRLGMTLHPRPDTWETERSFLPALARCPVLFRFYHHEGEAEWDFTLKCLRECRDMGHTPSIAMVQDRKAVTDPSRWAAFVHRIMEDCANEVEWVEVGHAINRCKWGCWTMEDYARLCEPFAPYAGNASSCKLMGPAVIDFEYQYLVAALKKSADIVNFDALSHHLYVDRRGAPENYQGRFSTVEKCALGRAIASWAPRCGSRFIVSEVNWPISGTDIWSPVNSPYIVPGPRQNDPGVSEDAYADYMLRYHVLTLCSGLVERVYWWRLAAHGFGLIDDRASNGWRLRLAFHFWVTFMERCGDARFIKRLDAPNGVYLFAFERTDGETLVMAYAHPETLSFSPSFEFAAIEDAAGHPVTLRDKGVVLTGRPVYFRQVSL